MPYILKVKNVSKSYKKKRVLKSISFDIDKGEIIGLVGPNGAGKTTLMKIIMNLIKNYEGELDFEENKKRIKQIGGIIENPSFYPNLSGRDNLKYFAEISGGYDKTHVDSIIKLMKIDGFVQKKVKNYSLGMKQRLGIAQALLNNPQFLILDEPTNGLDPEGVVEIREILEKVVKEKGISVLISSHILSEIENVCDKVLFLKNGELIQSIDLKNIDDNLIKTYIIETKNIINVQTFLESQGRLIQVIDDSKISFEVNHEHVEELIIQLVEEGIRFSAIYPSRDNLETKFFKVLGGNKIV
ncbi:ABC transporter ATP-binding protein [Rossellomorea marisflavi]|uniref:ABC transporter ATP-binding protein n=1 Tax=Rossellomorea marisflavi TaxID=189381 RepID=UPI0025C748D1|nr:ABC transporter ATP-binding protein [Rossellomorea marisflavi]GLI86438.1 ABC transporter ATP-binding protein [Rossellomorea marisflavi]